MSLRPELQLVVKTLLAESETRERREVSLDEIGVALGTLAVSTQEIDEIMLTLEEAGRVIDAPEGQHGERTLHIVLKIAREMRAELGRFPSPSEIAERAGLTLERVQHALALAKVMAR